MVTISPGGQQGHHPFAPLYVQSCQALKVESARMARSPLESSQLADISNGWHDASRRRNAVDMVLSGADVRARDGAGPAELLLGDHARSASITLSKDPSKSMKSPADASGGERPTDPTNSAS